MFGGALLPSNLDSTPTESRMNTNIASLPVSMDDTPMELLASPLYEGSLSLLSSLFIYLKENYALSLIYFQAKEGSKLIESGRGYSFIEEIETFGLCLLIYIFPLLHFF